jgi:predicted translin family RNA/ssDNA-binding protein
MATIARQQLQKLVDQLKASQEELVPFREEAADVSRLVASAAGEIERLVKQGDLEAAQELISRLWQSLQNFPVILAALSANQKAYHPTLGSPSEGVSSLQHTAEAVFFIQRLVRQINRNL